MARNAAHLQENNQDSYDGEKMPVDLIIRW
jgi:hypothetical protein